jgi:hypothetical protein
MFYQGPPIAPVRVPLSKKPFGAGLGERNPVHRAPVSVADLTWYEEQASREEELMFDRLGREYEAQQRMEMGLDA